MVCKKLDPQLFFCADNPNLRCVDVPFDKCKPEFDKKQPLKEAC
jgi:hypothetical protein